MVDESDDESGDARVLQEVSKTAGKAIDAASGAGRFFERVMGDLVTDGVGLLSDRLKYYRLERAVLLAQKTQTRLEDKGITNLRVVPPKIALPLIESGTLEDDDDLHTLWANLLASAMDEDHGPIERKYASVLADLTVEDAHLLYFTYYRRTRYRIKTKEAPIHGVPSGEMRSLDRDELMDFDEESIRNLLRLGLLASSPEEIEIYHPPEVHRHGDSPASTEKVRIYRDIETVELTEFGLKFCEAVMDDPSGS